MRRDTTRAAGRATCPRISRISVARGGGDNLPPGGVLAQIVDEAPLALWLQCLAYVPSMKDEPVMCVMSEFSGSGSDQRIFHVSRRLPGRDPGAVGHPEYVRVDRYCRLSEDCVEDDVRSFPSDPG